MSSIIAIRNEITKLASAEKAKASAWYFKTGKGQYGEGDEFIGLTVPEQRKIAGMFQDAARETIEQLLLSKVHEERLIGLFIFVAQFRKEKDLDKKSILFDFYLSHKNRVNNWDLVDSSAHKIVGEYLYETDGGITLLRTLAKSPVMWDRRIAIIATAAFIGHNSSKETFEIADILMHDKEDLMHKAVGWMLREVGKRISREVLIAFLQPRYKIMPRTMLRYAIEHFSKKERKAYLKGVV